MGTRSGTCATLVAALVVASCQGPPRTTAHAAPATTTTTTTTEPALPEALRLPPDFQTPLERDHGSRLVEILPDVRLNVVDVGREHPRALVFVHGDSASFDYWRPQIEHFKDRYRVVAYERAECGRSSGPVDALTYSSSAEHITRLVAALGIESYVVIAHSRGQEIAAFHFATAPKGLAGLVAEGTGVSVRPDAAARADAERAIARHRRGEHDLRVDCVDQFRRKAGAFAQPLGLTEAQVLELLAYACGRWRPAPGIMGGPDVDVEAQLAQVALPMLQIDGAAYRRDEDRRQTMQRFFRRGQLVLLEGLGHLPHVEAPALFNQHVDRFLAEIGFR